MTVEELKKICEGKIADGYGNSEIYLCSGDDFFNGNKFFPLQAGFSSVVYNEGASEKIIDDLVYYYGEESSENAVRDRIDSGEFVILN